MTAAICAGFAADARAITANWTSTTAGTWNAANTTFWNGGVPGSASGNTNTDTAVFNAATGVVVTTTTNWNIDNITFNGSGSYNLGSNLLVLTAGGTITDAATGTVNEIITAPLTLAGAYSALVSANTSNLTLSGAITGSSTFNISGSAATNSSYGATSVGSLAAFTGTLNILTGGYDKVSNITAADSATSQIINIGSSNTSTATLFNAQSIGSGVTINIYGAGNSEGYGALRAETGTIAAAITLETSNSSVGSNSGTSTLSGNISGAGDLTKMGGGTVALSGTNTWSGGTTTINAGTLQLNTSSSLPTNSIVAFTNTTGTATLNIQGVNQTLSGLTFGTQTTGTNTVTIGGNSGAALTVSPATLTFAPANTADVLAVTMATLSSFTYNNPTGTFSVNNGTQSGTSGTSTLTLPTASGSTASITAGTLNVGNIGGQSTGGATSSLNLSNATTIYADNIDLGASASRSIGNIQFASTLTGAETLKIRAHDGVSAANLLIGNTNSFAGDTTSYGGTFNAAGSGATLDALFATMTLGEAGVNGSSGRQAVSSGTFNMGAGTLTATTASLGTVYGTSTADTWTGTGVLTIGAGTANITTINMGVDSAVSGQTAVTLNATVNLNAGSTLNATTIALGSVTSGQTVTRTANINWNAGTIGNIAGGNLNISGASIVLAGTAAVHTFAISTGQTGNISSVISGTGPLTVNGAGTLNLIGASTFTGNTTLTAGTLEVSNTTGSALGVAANTITLNGGTLTSVASNTSVGFITGTVVAGSGAHTIAPGGVGTIGTLTIGGLTSSSNTTLAFDLGTGAGDIANGDILALGAAVPTIGASTAVSFNTSATTLGNDYRLISGTNLSSVALTNFSLPTPPTGQYYSLSKAVDNNFIDLVVTAGPTSNLTWNDTGGAGDGVTWDTINQNWNNGSSPSTFSSINQDIVTFNDVNNGNYNVTVAPGTVTPGSITVTTSNLYNFSGSGSIGGTGGLLLNGTGTLNLATANTFTGITNVSSGTLNLQNTLALQNSTLTSNGTVTFDAVVASNAFTLGGLSGSGNMVLQNNATSPAAIALSVGNNGASTTYSGVLSGPGSLIKIGAGTLTLSGANSYTGGTVVDVGSVIVSGNQSAATGGWLIGISSTTIASVNFSSGSTVVSTGLIQLGNTAANGGDTETLSSNGSVTNSGTLLAGRSGVLNINSGSTWNQSGPASVTAPSGSGFSAGPLTVNSGGVFNYTGTNAFGINPANANSGNATVAIAGGTFNTSQGFADTIATATGTGYLALTAGGTLGLTANIPQLATTAGSGFSIELGNGSGGFINTGAFNTSVGVPIINVSGQAGKLTKTGTGTLTLTSGTNTYSGTTIINGGTVIIGASSIGTTSGPLGIGAVTVGQSTTATLLTGGAFNISNAITAGAITSGVATVGGNTDDNSAFTGLITNQGTLTVSQVANTGTNALTIAGGITSANTGIQPINFIGPGNINVTTTPISDGTLGKSAVNVSAGTVTFSASNNYSGGTSVVGGTLLAAAANTLSPNSAVNVSGGTLDVSGFANTVPSFVITSAGTLNLGLGNVLTSTGAVTLAGTLNLSGAAGTLPEILMAYSSETGTFAATNGVPAGDTLSYTGTQLVLITSGPANLTWNNLGGSPADGTTWDIATNQNWNNGTGAAVYHEGDLVTFNDTNNNNYAVALNTVVHPKSVTVATASAYAISGTGGIANVASGTTPLTLSGTGSLTLGGSNTYTGGTTVGTGTDSPKLVLTGSNSLPVGSALTVNSGATVQVAAHTGGASNIVVATAGSLTNNGLIDITNNDLIVRGLTLSAVTTQVTSGFGASGVWNGTTGITSSSAASNPLTAVGVLLNDNKGSAIYSTFDGASTVDGDVLVKYTYYGDANLDGAVDGSDYTMIDAGFNSGGTLTGWQNGDFNYDGKIDGSDYTLIDNAFNTQGATLGSNPAVVIATATAQFAGGSSAVPEPTTLGLLGIGAAGLLARRRRR